MPKKLIKKYENPTGPITSNLAMSDYASFLKPKDIFPSDILPSEGWIPELLRLNLINKNDKLTYDNLRDLTGTMRDQRPPFRFDKDALIGNAKTQLGGMLGSSIGGQLGGMLGGNSQFGQQVGSQLGSLLGSTILLKGGFKNLNAKSLGGIGASVLSELTGGSKLKGSLDGAIQQAASMAWLVNPVFGAVMTGVMAANNLGARKTTKFEGNDFMTKGELAATAGSYKGANKFIENAGQKAGSYGLLGGVVTGQFSRAENDILKANSFIDTLGLIYDTRELGQIRGEAMADINSLGHRFNTTGGYDLYLTRVGKAGMRLPTKQDINRIKLILNSKKDIELFKKGGQMSVIPEGALHARLHHLEGIDNITRKGIPVVDKSGELQAEIERNEIIFSLEVTNKLEQLREDGSDAAAIEAGKLLVNEIFHNTDDRTGLIQEVIGTDEAKKPIFKDGGTIEEEEPYSDVMILSDVEPTVPTHKPEVPTFIIDSNPRTDILNGIIYYNTPESKIHEYYGHYNPNLMLMKLLASYWTDLNDDKLREFGTDLLFVKRFENDPGHFFNPEEVLGRIEAARYMLGKDIYNISPQFFIDLKENNELKYGDNLRDLLHMYNPQILTEIFKKARLHMNPKLQDGGLIEAEEPVDEEEIEQFANGDKIHLHFVYKPRLKPKYEDWIKDVNPEYLSDNYDIKIAYEVLPFEQLERWKFGVNSNDPKYYMDYQDNNGIYTYHLPSVAELDNGDYIFLKKGTENTNPELHFETDMYHNGENGFKNTHDLKFEGDRYYYRKKKSFKKEDGGIVDQINKLSPDKLLELENILKYLNQ